MVERAGPDPEFLHVVTHGSHLAGVSAGGFLEICYDLLDAAERNEVAKNFLTGNQANGLPVIFGDVVGKQFVGLEASREEVNVVENGVTDVGFRENGSELRLPNALGKPPSRGTLAKMVLDIVGETEG